MKKLLIIGLVILSLILIGCHNQEYGKINPEPNQTLYLVPNSDFNKYLENYENRRLETTGKCRNISIKEYNLNDPWCEGFPSDNFCRCYNEPKCLAWKETNSSRQCLKYEEKRKEEFYLK
jgi:hypothetical protein